jgi:hypothetical protein
VKAVPTSTATDRSTILSRQRKSLNPFNMGTILSAVSMLSERMGNPGKKLANRITGRI